MTGTQHPQQLQSPPQPQHQLAAAAACDESLGVDWVSDTVSSAVAHLFGGSAEEDHDDNDGNDRVAVHDEGMANCNVDVPVLPLQPGPATRENQSAPSPLAVPDEDAASTDDNNASRATDNGTNVGNIPTSNSDLAIDTSHAPPDEPLTLLGRARSLTPSFPSCGLDHLTLPQCDSAPANFEGADDFVAVEALGLMNLGGSLAPSGDDDMVGEDREAVYKPYFSPSDFTPSTWIVALHETPSLKYCGAGAAGALTAVLVVHPLALMGAAATAAVSAVAGASALWAVGFFHELDKGYQIWNGEEFGALFWEEGGAGAVSGGPVLLLEEGEPATVIEGTTVGELDQTDGKMEEGASSKQPRVEDVVGDGVDAGEEQLSKSQNQRQQPPKKGGGYMLRRIKSAPVRAGLLSSKSSHKDGRPTSPQDKLKTKRASRGSVAKAPSSSRPPLAGASTQQSMAPTAESLQISPTATTTSTSSETTTTPTNVASMDSQFPPLEVCVVRDVELHGLNASEVFDVFFADDAPYSFRDFQKKRGDVDIIYGKWEQCSGNSEGKGHLYSYKSGRGHPVSAPIPANATRQRTLSFNTLTRSYFGPAYGKATKTQRATHLSDRLLVIENITQLADIPFSDRFWVMERWVVEAVENDAAERQSISNAECDESGDKRHLQPSGTDEAPYSTSCRLSVHAEVQMLKSCSWEAQIRKKARETFTEVLSEWCRSATTALRATEEQKRRRLMLQREEEEGVGAMVDAGSSHEEGAGSPAEPLSPTLALFERHQRNFEKIDRLVAKGELELSVEVVHSLRAGRGSAFARVLENGELDVVGRSATVDDFHPGNGPGRMSASVSMRGKGRKLFKKLSTRASKSRPG